MKTSEKKVKNVTITDILNLINNEDDPIDVFATNASAIRKKLGRGSFATIQKFLNKIRDDIKKSENNDHTNEFELPKPAIENIVSIVCSNVNSTILEKVNGLNEDRDQLRADLGILSMDNKALVEEVESLEKTIDERDAQIITMTDAEIERAKAYEDEIISLSAKLEEAHDNNKSLKEMFEKYMSQKL